MSTDKDVVEPPNTAEASNIHKISARLPAFWPEAPELYFASIEASFKLSGIVSETTKFLSLVAALDQQTMLVVADLIRSPDPETPYTVVRDRLINEFTVSEVRRIQIVLKDLCLGDLKPSAFLRRMREQAGTGFSESGLKSIWLSHMPSSVQSILSTLDDKDLSGLAAVADKIFDVTNFEKSQFCDSIQTGLPVSSPAPKTGSSEPNVLALQSQVNELAADVKSLHNKIDRLLKNQNFRGRSRGRSFSRNAAEANDSKETGLCWYHKNFADKAKRCIEPCSYAPKN